VRVAIDEVIPAREQVLSQTHQRPRVSLQVQEAEVRRVLRFSAAPAASQHTGPSPLRGLTGSPLDNNANSQQPLE